MTFEMLRQKEKKPTQSIKQFMVVSHSIQNFKYQIILSKSLMNLFRHKLLGDSGKQISKMK